MTMLKTAFAVALAVSATAVFAAKPDAKEAAAQLSHVLSCKKAASPEEVIGLVSAAGGKAVVQASDLSDGEYKLANPIDVFGRPVTTIRIHQGENYDGDFNEYSGEFSGESIATIAKYADVEMDEVGDYRKEIGNHNLTLHAESLNTYITCSNDVRTITKTIKRTAKNVGEKVSSQFDSN